MRQPRRSSPRRAAPRMPAPVPLPVTPLDLLAGLAPGVELTTDDTPPGVAGGAPRPRRTSLTVSEAGRMLRAGDGVIRRLIRTEMLRPVPDDAPRDPRHTDEPCRAGVLPRRRDKPGE